MTQHGGPTRAPGEADGPGPGVVAAGWPREMPAALLQRWVDVQAILALEAGDARMHARFHQRMLSALLDHTMRHSPWWRARLATVLARPAQGTALADLPVLERADLARQVETEGALPVPASHGEVRLHSTSGSSGMPLRFHVTDRGSRMNAHQYEADDERQGRSRQWPRATLNTRAEPHPDRPHHHRPAQPALGEAGEYLRYWHHADARGHALWLGTLGVELLSVAPILLEELLDVYEAEPDLPRPRLRQVLTYAETVTPALRERAAAVTGAQIRDRYSCEEAGPLAFQCPRDPRRYHVAVGHVLLEVVDDAGRPCAPGEPGHVLVTALHQWATPMIRYALGDIAALHPGCSCGARVPSLSQLLGRRRALLRAADGSRHYVMVRAREWLEIAPVRRHLIRQTAPAEVLVEVELDGVLDETARQALQALVERHVGERFAVRVSQVGRIEPPASFKRSDVVGLDPA